MKFTISPESISTAGGSCLNAKLSVTAPHRLNSLELTMAGSNENPVWTIFPLDCEEVNGHSFVPEMLLEIFELEEILPSGATGTLIINAFSDDNSKHTFEVKLVSVEDKIKTDGEFVSIFPIPEVVDNDTIEERRQFSAETYMEDEGFASDLLEACDDQEEAESLFSLGEEWAIETADETIRITDFAKAELYIILRVTSDEDCIRKRVLAEAAL